MFRLIPLEEKLSTTHITSYSRNICVNFLEKKSHV